MPTSGSVQAQQDAQAETAAADARLGSGVVGGAAPARVADPRPAAKRAKSASRRPLRILLRRHPVIVLVEPVAAPLPDIAVQVVKPESIAREGVHRRCLPAILPLRPSVVGISVVRIV